MRAPFSCESMACLSFMHLPLPADLSGPIARSTTHFFNPLWRE